MGFIQPAIETIRDRFVLILLTAGVFCIYELMFGYVRHILDLEINLFINICIYRLPMVAASFILGEMLAWRCKRLKLVQTQK